MPVRTLAVSTPTDHEVVVTRAFDAPRTSIFDAWTGPEHLPHWMLGPDGWTMTACEIDLRVGGAWRFSWHNADGAELTIAGEYREIDRPARLVSTESWGEPWPEALSILDLTEEAGVTTLVNTVVYPSKEARDAALKTGMTDGMEATFARLEPYLASLG